VLTLENISFLRDEKLLFTNLGFSLDTGSALIITGCNGSGKTTLLKIIAGILKQNSGQILWQQQDISLFPSLFYGDLQYISDKNFFIEELTVIENLNFYSSLSGNIEALQAAISFFNIDDIIDCKIKNLSSGMLQKIKLVKLLANPATIWLLDELSSNLDIDNNKSFKFYPRFLLSRTSRFALGKVDLFNNRFSIRCRLQSSRSFLESWSISPSLLGISLVI
jgi:heme exporter protein A